MSNPRQSNQHQALYPSEDDLQEDALLKTLADRHLSAITLLQEQIAHEEAELEKLIEKHGIGILLLSMDE